MKKFVPGLLTGLVLGGFTTWLMMKHQAEAAAEPDAPKIEVTTGLDAIARQIAASGITTAGSSATTVQSSVTGYGRVLDPGTLINLLADVETARTAAAASDREFARARVLHDQDQNISTQAFEAAQSSSERDRAQLGAARARLLAAWGTGLANRQNLPALADSIASGTAALVRIDLPNSTAAVGTPSTAQVGALTAGSELHAVEIVGPAPSADPQSQGAGYLALWRERPLPPGTAVRAVFAGAAQAEKALLVPRSALVRHEGAVFVYVPIEKGGFERRLVTTGPASGDGVAITSGIAADDKVVVTGAQQLLATELLSSSEPEE